MARAGCGGVETASPKHKVAPRPPLAVGDSSMLLALPALARVGYKVNARGCRQFAEGLRLLRDTRRRHHELPHLVVLALGADASVTAGEIQQAKKILGPEAQAGSRHAARARRRAVERRERDPQRGSAGSGAGQGARLGPLQRRSHNWFQPDGLHLTFTGAKAFARLLKKLVPLA